MRLTGQQYRTCCQIPAFLFSLQMAYKNKIDLLDVNNYLTNYLNPPFHSLIHVYAFIGLRQASPCL